MSHERTPNKVGSRHSVFPSTIVITAISHRREKRCGIATITTDHRDSTQFHTILIYRVSRHMAATLFTGACSHGTFLDRMCCIVRKNGDVTGHMNLHSNLLTILTLMLTLSFHENLHNLTNIRIDLEGRKGVWM